MSGFKLLAIVPLKGCDSKYRKNLKVGHPHKFYKNYKIELNEDNSRVTNVILLKNGTPEELYRLKNGINLSFSAVVGENGTGKSSLFELLYYFIYVICSEKTIEDRKVLNTELEDLKKAQKKAQDYYYWLDNSINIQKKIEDEIKLNEFEASFYSEDFKEPLLIALEIQKKYKIILPQNKLKSSETVIQAIKSELSDNILRIFYVDIENEGKWENEIRTKFSLSIIYQVNKQIREVSYIGGKFCYSIINSAGESKIKGINKFELDDFFYNVSLNYSHHSLNSNTLGKWINKLFHKNDAYTTPVVINPMRNSGNFNINHELKLSKERLMANLLYDLVQKKKNLLLGKYSIKKYILSPKILSGLPVMDFTENFINNLQSKHLFQEFLKINQLDDRIEYWDFAIGYLEQKINRINDKYDYLIYKDKSLFDEKETLDKFLLEDSSHITKKIRQVLNFLKVTNEEKNRDFWKIPEGTVRIELSEKKMMKWLNLFQVDLMSKTPSQLIEYGLPGFFNIDFLLEDEEKEEIEFSKLSSGEQQIILNTNSILYHLYNLNSIHKETGESDKPKRIAYSNVNIILDEVELYYHPEMQRKLINELVTSFELIKHKRDKGIESINVCVLTHSPFILSDIPFQNVLSLNKNEDAMDDSQTFGANIHEMLLGNFFMKSTTGEYVRRQINELLDLYNKIRIENSEKKLKNLKKKYLKNEIKYEFLKEKIGEDVIRGILSNHIDFIREKLNLNK